MPTTTTPSDGGTPAHAPRRSSWRRPRVVVPLAVVLALAAGAGAWAATRPGSTATAGTTTTLQAATTGTLAQTLSASGTVANATTSDLSFSTTGTVTAVGVVVGSTVTRGEVLARVDSTSLANAVAQDKATVAADRASVDGDESDGASAEQLAADGATLAADQSQLAEAVAALSDATLVSPIAGTVTVVGLAVGDQVGSGSGSGSAQAATGSGTGTGTGTGAGTGTSSSASTDGIEVVSTGAYVANVTVDDTEVGELAVGNEVRLVRSSATSSTAGRGFPGGFGGGFGGGTGTGTGTGGGSAAATVDTTPFFGTVASIGLTPSSSSGVASYPVVVDVTGSPAKLLSGATVTATITYKTLVNVVEVPTQAVHTTGTGSAVTESRGGRTTEVAVVTGASSGGETQIVSGLAAGDMVEVTTVARGAGRGLRGTGGFGGAGGFGGGG